MLLWLNSADPVIIFKDKESALYNRAASDFFHLPAEQEINTPLDLLAHHQPDNFTAAERWLYLRETVLREKLAYSRLLVRSREGKEVLVEGTFTYYCLNSNSPYIVSRWIPLNQAESDLTSSADTFIGIDSLMAKVKSPGLLSAEETTAVVSSVSRVNLSGYPPEKSISEKIRKSLEVTRSSYWRYCFRLDQVEISSELSRLLGISEQEEQLPREFFVRNYLSADSARKLRYIKSEMSGRSYANFKEITDLKLTPRRGFPVSVLVSFRLQASDSDELEEAYGICQDISQLQLVEQELEQYRNNLENLVHKRTLALRKSEAKLADALKLARLGTWEFNWDCQAFEASEGVLEVFGTTQEIEGGMGLTFNRIKDVVYEKDYPLFKNAVRKALRAKGNGYTDSLELRIKRSDSELRNIFLSIKSIPEGNGFKFMGTLQDISDIRQAENEKDQLTHIIETTTDIVGIAGLDGGITYLNEAGKKFFGIKQEDKLSSKTFRSFQNQRSGRILNQRSLQQANTQGTWTGENYYLRYDGAEVPVSQVVVAHKNKEGLPVCYSTIIRDISDQKKAEQDLLFKNAELDTFIYRASHDLRGPIATLLGLHNISHFEVQDPKALELLNLYQSQILRLNTITVSLIELTKIKDHQLDLEPINAEAVAESVINNIKQLPESREVDFQLEGKLAIGIISDKYLIETILANLIENSVRYRQSQLNSFVKIELIEADPDGVILKVSDNGIGIDADLQHKIYNMFFRASENSKGPGLGLYTLKYAVEKLKGSINLYSVPYQGTTFTIHLPNLAAYQPAGLR